MQYSLIQIFGVCIMVTLFNPGIRAEAPMTFPANRGSNLHYSNERTPRPPEVRRPEICPAHYLPVVCDNGAQYSNACVAHSHGAKNCQLKQH